MSTRYWFISGTSDGRLSKIDISRADVEGYDTLIDGRWGKVPGYRARGLKVYRFEDRKFGKTVIVVNTYQECFRFAAWCHDTIHNGKWRVIDLRDASVMRA